MSRKLRWFTSGLLLAAALSGFTGCKSTGDEVNERPWNAPKSWETGLPAGMTEGR